MKQERLLTFEMSPDGELLEIHANSKGLESLIKILTAVLERNMGDHTHLMIPDWGGTELSNEKQGSGNVLIPHVKVYRWHDA